MTQTAQPASDISNTGWTPSTGAVLWDCINDWYYGGTGDPYIRSTNSQTCEVKLTPLLDPVISTGHVFMLSARAAGSGSGEKLTAALYQGSTLIATIISGAAIDRTTPPGGGQFNYVPGSAGTTLTATQANAITDYTDLRIRLTSAVSTGETLDVIDVKFSVPNAPVTNEGVCELTGTSAVVVVGHLTKLLQAECSILEATYLGTFHLGNGV